MVKKRAGEKFPSNGYYTLRMSRTSALKEIREKHNFRDNTKRLIRLYELSSGKKESKAILRHNLQASFLKSMIVRTIAEEQCMKLAEAVARIDDTTSRFKPETISLNRGLKLYNAMLYISKTSLVWHKKSPSIRSQLEKRVSEIKDSIENLKAAIRESGHGSLKDINYPEISQISFSGSEMIRVLRNSEGFSEYAKIGFEEIDRIIREEFRGRRQ